MRKRHLRNQMLTEMRDQLSPSMPGKATLEPLLVDARCAAAMLSISPATFWRWVSSGELGPAGMKKGGRRLWALAELRAWVVAGMPDRLAWTAQRNGQG